MHSAATWRFNSRTTGWQFSLVATRWISINIVTLLWASTGDCLREGNQPPKSTQPGHPSVGRHNVYQLRLGSMAYFREMSTRLHSFSNMILLFFYCPSTLSLSCRLSIVLSVKQYADDDNKISHVTRMSDTLSRHPHSTVHQNAAIFEFFRDFDHILLLFEITSHLLKPSESV